MNITEKFPAIVLISSVLVLSCTFCTKVDKTSVTVNLTPMQPSDSISIRWSPKGEKLTLTNEGADLVAQLNLGMSEVPPVRLVLSKSGDSDYPDLLHGDWNRNGALDDDSIIRTRPSESRGKIWSSFNALIEIPVKDPATGREDVNPYPLSFWYVYDPLEPDAEKVIRYSRRGWMQGSFELDTLKGLILICEMEMNGIYDSLDNWVLALPSDPKELYGTGSRSCTDHAWLGGQAFKMNGLDPSGRQVKLTLFNPGMTRAEEATSRDQLAADRNAARSGMKVDFSRDYAEASKKATVEKKPLLVDFETTWCGPCKQMDQFVYNADRVVEKAIGMIAVKVDGDENRDLVSRFEVKAYPTIILVGADGKELRRLVGYQSVKQMVDFLSL